MYYKILPNGYILQNSLAENIDGLVLLQKIVFPTLSPDEQMQEKHYKKHLEIFPDGQFVILDKQRVIGMTTTIRYPFVLDNHTFLEISDGLFMTTHQKNGDWLYGMDLGIHPDYRGRGLARELYKARQEICRNLGLKGQLIVGLPYGYSAYATTMTLTDYFESLLRGLLVDPTVSIQQKIGFDLLRLLPNYVNDPQCHHAGILMALTVDKNI